MTDNVLCIGSALWDVIARSERDMAPGHDCPGRITRQPGGVALNVAIALSRAGLNASLMSALGNDPEGDALLREISRHGVDTTHVMRASDPTDTYVAIEGPSGEVFAAVADCYTLEIAGARVLDPLTNGRLASLARPFQGAAVIDGNLPEAVLKEAIAGPLLAGAKRVFVPASPGKARRLGALLEGQSGTLFVNRIEAELICECRFADSREAATALAALGPAAIVTDGPREASIMRDGTCMSVTPPEVEVRSVTGAGDAFLAGFLAADLAGDHPMQSMIAAAESAARHVAGGTG